MTQQRGSSQRRRQSGRWIGWTAIVLGILMWLGGISSLIAASNADTSVPPETAASVLGQLIGFAIGTVAIVYGFARLRR